MHDRYNIFQAIHRSANALTPNAQFGSIDLQQDEKCIRDREAIQTR